VILLPEDHSEISVAFTVALTQWQPLRRGPLVTQFTASLAPVYPEVIVTPS
jgi:hypothetical protein